MPLLLTATSGAPLYQQATGGINVTQYAVGDGVTDDTLAIRSAIAAAGANGTLYFPPGKTFLITGALEPLAGQTWLGYGAIIKRASEVSSATATAISAGPSSTAIVLASAADFTVGQDVTVYNGASYDAHNHRITAIVGNTITVSTAFTTAFPGGGTVIRSLSCIYASGLAGIRLYGLEINGNSAGNPTLQKWDIHAEIYLGGCDRGRVVDVYAHDCQCEGIEIGGANVTVDSCYVLNAQGNGIHLSGSNAGGVRGCYVKNCNLAGTGPGHADGCIIASNSVADTMITGCYCENGISGIGSWDSDDDSSLICTGNTIRNCTSTAFEGQTPSGAKIGKIIFTNNLIYNSIKIALECSNATIDPTQGSYRILMAENYLEDTTISVSQSQIDCAIRGNTIVNTGTSALLVYINKSANIAVTNNTIVGGGYGVYLDGSTSRDVLIANNTIKNQQSNGVRVNAAPVANCLINGNVIVQEAAQTPSSSYAAIQPANGVNVLNNSIDIGTNTTGQYGILCPNGGASAPGSVIANNIVRSLANVPSIRTAGGSQNNIILNNYVVQAVSNAGGGNTVSGNVTIL